MGHTLSCHRSSSKPTLRPLKVKHQLSAACNFADLQSPTERLDLNVASEEELMTLQGVDRILARDIVAYRARIGGFRKVEDVALVTGVGAARMARMKSEVCVTEPGSVPNLFSLDLLSTTRVDVNTTSTSHLQSMTTVTPELAQAVVLHRTVHGPFHRSEELGHVKGLEPHLLTRLLPQVNTSRPRPASTYTDLRNDGLARPCAAFSFHSLQEVDLGLPPRWATPMRPLSQPFSGVFNERPVLRVATWNLKEFSTEKAQNPGVREVVCLTLLENGIQLLAVQEVLHEEALEKVCLELESPSTAAVREWPGDRGTWRYVLMDPPQGQEGQEVERVAFLWDCSSGLELVRAVTVETRSEGNASPQSQPLLGSFKMEALEFSVFNLHLRLDAPVRRGQPPSNPQPLATLTPFLKELCEKKLLALGHMGAGPEAGGLAELRDQALEPLVLSDCPTELPTRGTERKGCLQNIWASHMARDTYTGRWGVIQTGLSSPWIPDGWSWGGSVSNHCPVWVELYMK
ncbi:EEPD1 protein, partial [Amia calva]|nr:EEPD1 protein [Amia calva]